MAQITVPATTAAHHPSRLLAHGFTNSSPEEVSEALRRASETLPRYAYQELIKDALFRAVYRGSTPLTEAVLTHREAPLDTLSPRTVATAPSVDLVSTLVSHGWDLNKRVDRGPGVGRRLLHFVCGDEALVHWLLDHGATVVEESNATDRARVKKNNNKIDDRQPSVLESVATFGSVDTFKHLLERGAVPSRTTLHHAVGASATSKNRDHSKRMDMVKYLVDEVALPVNQMDTDVQLFNHWGPPLNYAAKSYHGGADAVKFLLERGADPRLKDCYGLHDAFAWVEVTHNQPVAEALDEWKKKDEMKEEVSGT